MQSFFLGVLELLSFIIELVCICYMKTAFILFFLEPAFEAKRLKIKSFHIIITLCQVFSVFLLPLSTFEFKYSDSSSSVLLKV